MQAKHKAICFQPNTNFNFEGGVLAPVEIGGLFSTRRGSRTKEERESGTKPRPLRG